MKPKQEYKQLDYQERQTIAVCLELGLSIRAIARVLDRAPSTVCREINRNSGGTAYSCRFAHQRFVRRRRLSRPAPKLVAGNALFASVHALLRLRWSPQQIASRLATLHPRQTAFARLARNHLQRHLCPAPGGATPRAHCLFAPGAHQALAPLARRRSPGSDR